jgi:hypothetical protein
MKFKKALFLTILLYSFILFNLGSCATIPTTQYGEIESKIENHLSFLAIDTPIKNQTTQIQTIGDITLILARKCMICILLINPF